MYSPSKPTAFTMASATALMLTSSSSPTVKIRDQKDSMEREVDMINLRESVLYLAPHTPGGLQVVLVDLVNSIWSPPGFHKNSHITPHFSGVHLESTWSSPGVHWTPSGLQLDST